MLWRDESSTARWEEASSLAEDEDIGDTGFEEEDEKDDHPSAEKR